MMNLPQHSPAENDYIMNERIYILSTVALMVIGVLCAAFIPDSTVKVIAVVIILLSLSLFLYLYYKLRKETGEMRDRCAALEGKMKNYGIFRTAAEKCVMLENRLAALEAIPEVDDDQTLGLQLSRLNNSLANIIPDYKNKGYESLMEDLAAAVRSEEFLYAFRDKAVRPFMNELKHCEMPASSEDMIRLTALMMELAMSSVDLVDTFRENINARSEQRLTKDILLGMKTREQAYAAAKIITDNPMETPVWARVIKSMAVQAGIADRHILYSGYKIMGTK